MAIEMPTVQELFYGHNEPTYILNTEPLRTPRNPHMVMASRPMPIPAFSRDVAPPRFQTRALAAPPTTAVTHIHHPPGLELQVPMCCEKCIEKVRAALMEVEGVRDVICDQYQQKVIISGAVDPEKALRRVRRVKKKSAYWKSATQPLKYSASAPPEVHTRALVNPYRVPTHSSSAYSRYISPPRRYTSSYSRSYSSPYIDSSYRTGYGEPGYGHYNSAYDRFGYAESRYGPYSSYTSMPRTFY